MDLPVEMVVLHNLCLPLQFKNSILREALSVNPPRSEKYSLTKKKKIITSVVFVPQEFLKKEQERKEADLLAEKQEASRKRKEEKRIAREVTNTSFFQIFYFIS